jgi:hypothetical protein
MSAAPKLTVAQLAAVVTQLSERVEALTGENALLNSSLLALRAEFEELGTSYKAATAVMEDMQRAMVNLHESNRHAHARLDSARDFLKESILPRISGKNASHGGGQKMTAPPFSPPVDSDPTLPVYGGGGSFYQFVPVEGKTNTTTRRPVHGPARPALEPKPAPAPKPAPKPANPPPADPLDDDDCPF